MKNDHQCTLGPLLLQGVLKVEYPQNVYLTPFVDFLVYSESKYVFGPNFGQNLSSEGKKPAKNLRH